MPEKTEKAAANSGQNGGFMSIREVSALTGVPPHTLRFWEKQMPDILRPERTPGGQRRYDRQTAERIRMIKRLSDEKRHSLAAIRRHMGAMHGFAQRLPDPRKKVRAERAMELIVDEVAGLLKERLLDLLEAEKVEASGNADPGPTGFPPPEPEGGKRLGLER